MRASPSAADAVGCPLSEAEVEKLRSAFGVFDTDQNGVISVEKLGEVMRSLGEDPSVDELRELIEEVDLDHSGTIDFEELKALMTARQGDRPRRLRLAFSILDRDGDGRITAAEMSAIMSQVGLTAAELDEMIKEVDEDGDGSIDFAELCKLVPEAPGQRPGGAAPRSTGVAEPAGSPAATGAAAGGEPRTREQPGPAPLPDDAPATAEIELARLREQLARQAREDLARGTSTLGFQIGLFRLIQGAAYRCFRESLSAHHETHLEVRNLPYRITELVPFVRVAMKLYKELGVVDEACHPMIDAVVQSIDAEHARLQDRIERWPAIAKTREMLDEHEAMVAARSRSASTREKLAAGIELAITMQKRRLGLSDVVEGVLAVQELNRLREEELEEEQGPAQAPSGEAPRAYLARWNRVILDNALEQVDGAMMPVAYFYEDFMPKLLTAFTVSTADHVAACLAVDDATLNGWFTRMQEAGEFQWYGRDLVEAFPRCSPAEKLRLLQGWWLARHYLNGVQKQRERTELQRSSGSLAQYIAFIDVYLGRSDVRDSRMRISFPYYLGTAVWRFLHTTAEIIGERPAAEQPALIATFKELFRLFATMYPCPYCRHHLNAYVVQNKEVDRYPVEYLLLGHDPESAGFQMSLEDKLETVTDGASLRMFLWKLHNTVSSSIAPSEEWYHREENALYTTRYWPSLAFELARARALHRSSIPVERIERSYRLLRPVGRLAGVRLELQRLLAKGDRESIQQIKESAQETIGQLEQNVLSGRFLEESYRFDPNLSDPLDSPFSDEEAAPARSGLYGEA